MPAAGFLVGGHMLVGGCGPRHPPSLIASTSRPAALRPAAFRPRIPPSSSLFVLFVLFVLFALFALFALRPCRFPSSPSPPPSPPSPPSPLFVLAALRPRHPPPPPLSVLVALRLSPPAAACHPSSSLSTTRCHPLQCVGRTGEWIEATPRMVGRDAMRRRREVLRNNLENRKILPIFVSVKYRGSGLSRPGFLFFIGLSFIWQKRLSI